ncbi:carbamoyltransferase C-terminal domain-containing protein [Nocardia brevicatena]|uniref:carbamoyltransferase C-terminal domain-containing protein n=1 Tax=Nocardia brevicatena TaxID=37327 RepID=UPI0002F60A0D|nr:carbamoyltransferase C-terminal domain-containing protein [Nocardia brevicatena]
MTILIGWANDLDASAVLAVDGIVVGAVAEERFTREKQQTGFPANAIQHLLDSAGLKLRDVDEWAYGWFRGDNANQLLPGLCERVARQADDRRAVEVMLTRLDTEHSRDAAIRDSGYAEAAAFGVPVDRIRAYEHHPSHAWSAFAFCPFDEALVVTADGRGDRKSITLSRGDARGVHEFEWYSSIDSLGHIYSQVTAALGFRTNRHEGKIMGLAAHGDPSESMPFLSELVGWSNDRIQANPGEWFIPSDSEIPPKTLERMLTFKREDLAAGVQALVEDLLCRLVASRVGRTGLRRIALAGGVMANVQLNRRIRELPDVEAMFVQPNMGDGGLPLGAVAASHHRRTGQAKIRWDGMALGPGPCGESVSREPSVRFASSKSAVRWLVAQLIDFQVVGLVRGACEFGPRALCHRSILVDASRSTINNDLNRRLHRTEFMPFAPVMTDRAARLALSGWSRDDRCAPFMTTAYVTHPDFRQGHPAVIHADGSVRPQVITHEADPFMHAVLEEYERQTGRVALINTSFNLHEEPIVLTIDDALRALDAGAVDAVFGEDAAWGTGAAWLADRNDGQLPKEAR